jgi:hypothetical protein
MVSLVVFVAVHQSFLQLGGRLPLLGSLRRPRPHEAAA